MDELKVLLDALAADSAAEIGLAENEVTQELETLERQEQSKAASKAELWLRGEREKAENEASLAVSARQAEGRRELLAWREQCAAEVFAAVREKIAAFTASADYPAHLARQLREAKDALGEGDMTLWLRKEDLVLGGELLKAYPGAQLQEGDFALGGLRLSVGSRRADLSYDTALRELRGRFADLSGLEMRS